MFKYLFIPLFLLCFKSFSQSDTLTAEQATKYLDKLVIVKDKVAGARLFEKDGKKTYLVNLDKRYPHTPLTVVFYTATYDKLPHKQELDGKTICVRGTVTLYNNRPQIIVEDIQEFKILD